MKKKVTLLTLIVFGLTAGFSFGQSYTEDFEDGDVSDWLQFWVGEDVIIAVDVSATPSVLPNGDLKVGYLRDVDTSYTGYAQSLMGTVGDKNYTVEADVYVYQNTATSSYTGIVVYADYSVNYYVKLVADFDADNRLRIYNNKLFSGDPWGYSIDATNLDKTEGWHHMKVKAATNETDNSVAYQCWYDGFDLGTYIDTSQGHTTSGNPGVFSGPNVDGYFDNFIVESNGGTAIDREKSLPVTMTLKQNFPNPFNPSTTISFDINEEGSATLQVFTLKGELVNTLVSGHIRSGSYQLTWDGTNVKGQALPSGSYLVVLSKGNEQLSRSMLMIK